MSVIGRCSLINLLSNPYIFHYQQIFCNTYKNIKNVCSDVLTEKDISILDIGCSTAAAASKIVNFETNKYTGIDISEPYINFAANRHPNANFLVMDARQMTFETASFDVVMFTGVIHHLEDSLVNDCLREVKRVLRPNGTVLFAEPIFTPNDPWSNLLLSFDRGNYIREKSEYLSLFNDFRLLEKQIIRFSAHRFLVAKFSNV